MNTVRPWDDNWIVKRWPPHIATWLEAITTSIHYSQLQAGLKALDVELRGVAQACEQATRPFFSLSYGSKQLGSLPEGTPMKVSGRGLAARRLALACWLGMAIAPQHLSDDSGEWELDDWEVYQVRQANAWHGTGEADQFPGLSHLIGDSLLGEPIAPPRPHRPTGPTITAVQAYELAQAIMAMAMEQAKKRGQS